jgi:hypothetical protein
MIFQLHRINVIFIIFSYCVVRICSSDIVNRSTKLNRDRRDRRLLSSRTLRVWSGKEDPWIKLGDQSGEGGDWNSDMGPLGLQCHIPSNVLALGKLGSLECSSVNNNDEINKRIQWCKKFARGGYEVTHGYRKCLNFESLKGIINTNDRGGCTISKWKSLASGRECVRWTNCHFTDWICNRCHLNNMLTNTGKRAARCEPCPSGHECLGTSITTLVKAGHYLNVVDAGRDAPSNGLNENTRCPQGYFQNEKGQSYCKSCPIGQHQIVSGGIKCDDCPRAYFQAESGQFRCTKCAVGKYSTVEGRSDDCTSCPAGFYQSVEASESCIECEVGQYQDQLNQKNCINCPINYYQNEPQEKKCKKCEDGTFLPFISAPAQDFCVSCRPGYYISHLIAKDDPIRQEKGVNPAKPQKCELCPAGLYFDRTEHMITECKKCRVGRYSLSEGGFSEESCLQCGSGFYGPNLGHGERCFLCPRGYFQADKESTSCDYCNTSAGTWQLGRGQSHCKSCYAGTYFDTTQYSTAEEEADKQQYGVDLGRGSDPSPAIPSRPPSAEWDRYELLCQECPKGYYQSENTQLECMPCAVGFYQNTKGAPQCLPCDAAVDGGATSCPGCPKGKGGIMSSIAGCEWCEIGKFNTGGDGKCKDCVVGRYENEVGHTINNKTDFECKKCPKGSWSDRYQQVHVSTCKECEPGKYYDLTGGTRPEDCKQCFQGKWSNLASWIMNVEVNLSLPSSEFVCRPCGVGEYSRNPGRSFPCEKCAPGMSNSGEGRTTECESCPMGYYATEEGQVFCNSCPGGFYGNEEERTICKECILGKKQSKLSQLSCTNCTVGKYQNEFAKAQCKECSPGQFQDENHTTACKKCVLNTYTEKTGQIKCKACQVGLVTRNTAGAPVSGSNMCVSCLAGFFWKKNYISVAKCESCPGGYYSRPGNKTECLYCLKGTYSSNEKSSTDCTSCIRGKWSADDIMDRESTCKNCDEGRFSSAPGASSEAECIDCSSGRFGSEKGAYSKDTCKECSAGTYQSEQAQDHCKLCPPGFATETTASSQCLTCIPGRYSGTSGLKSCNLCRPGTYQDQLGMTTEILCKPGMKSEFNGSKFCIPCIPGQFQDEPGHSKCKQCFPGLYTSQSNATKPESCPIGFYADRVASASCSPCIPGRYQDQDASPKCKLCKAGQYQSNGSATSCIFCPAGYITEQDDSASCAPCVP